MFTGLIQGVAQIETVQPFSATSCSGVRIEVNAACVPGFSAQVGDSIALNGACLTVTEIQGMRFAADVSRETLDRTVGLSEPGAVNLERALRLGDALGGHLVSGHVDDMGVVRRFESVGESWALVIAVPTALARYVAVKGSIVVNGVSLTVNRVVDTEQATDIAINVIPHTCRVTTLGALRPADRVNLEVDLIARYVARMLEAPSLSTPS